MKLELNLDTALPESGAGACHLLARITAPKAPAGAEPAEPPPLELALVLDASGSMSGRPLIAAREAAAGVVAGLRPSDRLTVVSFADDVIVHTQSLAMDGAGREVALLAISRIETRGCTDLSSGWRTACELLLPEPGDDLARRRVAVLLSDGHANQGILEPLALTELARTYAAKGVVTSAVGLGDGYSIAQLAALVEGSGGRLHDAEDPSEMVEVLLGEVGGLSDVVAERAELLVSLSASAEVRELSSGGGSFGGGLSSAGELRLPIGFLRAGVTRTLALGIDVPASLVTLHVEARLIWYAPGASEPCRSESVSVEAKRVPSELDAQEREQRLRPSLRDAQDVLTAWEAGLVRRVTDLNRDGDYDALQRLSEEELPRILPYASHHPETQLHSERTLQLFSRAQRPIAERSRKVMADLSRKLAHAEEAYFSSSKGEWEDQLD